MKALVTQHILGAVIALGLATGAASLSGGGTRGALHAPRGAYHRPRWW